MKKYKSDWNIVKESKHYSLGAFDIASTQMHVTVTSIHTLDEK